MTNLSVTVHHFRIWDQLGGEMVVPASKRTAQSIKDIGGEIVPDTDQEVPISALGPDGKYDMTMAQRSASP